MVAGPLGYTRVGSYTTERAQEVARELMNGGGADEVTVRETSRGRVTVFARYDEDDKKKGKT